MLGGHWIRLTARLVFMPMLISGLLVVFSTWLGQNFTETEQVAFMSDIDSPFSEEGEIWNIYVLDVNRHVLDRLTWGKGSKRFPAWSPDGKRIAFHGNQRGVERNVLRFYDMYVVDADGRNLQLLTENHIDVPEDGYPGDAGSSMASWSPDGTRIGFHTGIGGTWNLAIMEIATQQVRYLTRRSGVDIYFEWGPDGERIVFARDNATDNYSRDIFTMTLNNRRITQITDRDVVYDPNSPTPISNENYPAWSPNGEFILFSSDQGGIGENLYLMKPDGSNITRLTDATYQDQFPVWKADGSGVAFNSNRAGRYDQIFTLDLETLTIRQLTNLDAFALAPSWKPN